MAIWASQCIRGLKLLCILWFQLISWVFLSKASRKRGLHLTILSNLNVNYPDTCDQSRLNMLKKYTSVKVGAQVANNWWTYDIWIQKEGLRILESTWCVSLSLITIIIMSITSIMMVVAIVVIIAIIIMIITYSWYHMVSYEPLFTKCHENDRLQPNVRAQMCCSHYLLFKNLLPHVFPPNLSCQTCCRTGKLPNNIMVLFEYIFIHVFFLKSRRDSLWHFHVEALESSSTRLPLTMDSFIGNHGLSVGFYRGSSLHVFHQGTGQV